MKVVFHEDFYQVYASDPAAASGRMEAITKVIEPYVAFVQAESASESEIAAVHSKDHIERVKTAGVYHLAALAAGGAIQAAEIGMKEPCFGLIRPPGHHASSSGAWGFCYFNNMAVALESLRRARKIKRAYVLDIDLHFGDGTVSIFSESAHVAVHNVSTRDRAEYLAEVKREMDHCEADIIGISAGFDNHRNDWGGTLETEDYRTIGRMVRKRASHQGVGCFAILEGGYNHRVLGHNVLALIQGLSSESVK